MAVVARQNSTFARAFCCKLRLIGRSHDAPAMEKDPVARQGSAPAALVLECAPLEFVSATIFIYATTQRPDARGRSEGVVETLCPQQSRNSV